jgi:thioredoxin reductase
MPAEDTDLLVVGAGPAGLAAAEAVCRGGWRVIVLEREPVPGGIPRHCHHPGFGLRDLHRVWSGPGYASRRVDRARSAGADIRTGWCVTGWAGPASLAATSRHGLTQITAGAVLLATGCRERPRPARLVPGSRPAGVLTTGALQQLVHTYGQRAGRVAVIVGAEHIAFSALHTLAASGTRVAAVVTESPVLQTFAALRLATAGLRRVPVLTCTRLTEITGTQRVDGVVLTDLRTGTVTSLPCDTVVFTGDWIPDHELARSAGLAIDPATRGPVVDLAGRTSAPGVFAAGNLVHPAEPADVAALGGAHAAAAINRWLADQQPGGQPVVPVRAEPPLAWVVPQNIRPGERPARRAFTLRASDLAGRGFLTVTQGGRILHRQARRELVPNRSITVGSGWLALVDPAAGPVTIGYRTALSGLAAV